MGPVDVTMLGEVGVRRDGRVVPCSSAKALELLGLLILRRRRPVPRDTVAELLWPGDPVETGRRALRQALWRLNTTLTAAVSPETTASPLTSGGRGGALSLDVGRFGSVDLLELEAAHDATADRAGADLGEAQARRLETAVAGYRGDLLPGCRQEWCVPERVRLHDLHLTVRDRLIGHHEAAGRSERALEHGRVALEADPARESTHRLLMRLHHRRGDRGGALRQFARCTEALREEYGVAPSAPTILLHQRILHDGVAGVPSPASHPSRDGDPLAALQERLDRIQATLDVLVRAVLPGPTNPPGPPSEVPAAAELPAVTQLSGTIGRGAR